MNAPNPTGIGGWKPGQSGNPSGRAKVVGEIRALARQHTELALQALVEVVKNKKAHPSARVAAANSILDRGYGRPEAKIELEARPPPEVFCRLPLEELTRLFELATAVGFEVREPQEPELLRYAGNGAQDPADG
jgi:uncharacterized protein DUF5681